MFSETDFHNDLLRPLCVDDQKLRTQISEKNILVFDAFRNPADLHLKNEYKQKRNCLISDLRNAEIDHYSKRVQFLFQGNSQYG